MEREPIATLLDRAKQKDPGFDLYWFAAALVQVDSYPDDMNKWPVDMLVNIDAGVLKRTFLDLSREIMNKIRKGKDAS